MVKIMKLMYFRSGHDYLTMHTLVLAGADLPSCVRGETLQHCADVGDTIWCQLALQWSALERQSDTFQQICPN